MAPNPQGNSLSPSTRLGPLSVLRPSVTPNQALTILPHVVLLSSILGNNLLILTISPLGPNNKKANFLVNALSSGLVGQIGPLH